MSPSKFVVCLFIISLLLLTLSEVIETSTLSEKVLVQTNATTPREVLIQANATNPREVDIEANDEASRPVSMSDFEFLVTGGYRPPDNDLVKYVVSLRKYKMVKFFGDNHSCGGAIITKRTILSAAHCFYDRERVTGRLRKTKPKSMRVVAGTPKRLVKTDSTQTYKVRRLLGHPNYRTKGHKYDVGLVILDDEVLPTAAIAIIPLANSEPEAGMKCTVLGWGTIIQYGPLPDEVVNGDVELKSNEYCKTVHPTEIRDGMICAGSQQNHEVDSCQGDSGGPMICNEMVYGIVSFGKGCGEPNSAGVYTDVYFYRQWISENKAARSRSPLLLLLLLLGVLLVMECIQQAPTK